nr:hypothetical protein [Glutamicibacter uratoxydans]
MKTSYSGLLRAAKDEVSKVEKLNPSRYFFITSQELTVGQKDELYKLFGRWMISSDDVYSGTDIDSLIARHSEVEREHVKLWLNSGGVLFNVINSGTINASARLLERAQEDMTRFVHTINFDKAKDILNAERTCLIAGPPGVGKTMLAHSLIVDAANHGFEPIEISDDIETGWRMFDPNRKQFFLYDDFLGAIALSEKLNKNEDRRIVEFMEKVSKSKKHLLVLTTREYILRDAEQTYLSLEEIGFSSRLALALPSYSRNAKAKILYNHVYHSELPSQLSSQFSDGGWKSVVDHRGFNPRLIKYATGDLLRDAGTDYLSQFTGILDNPVKLWTNAYDRHLNELQRRILQTLCSFQGVSVELLTTAIATSYQNSQHVTGRETKLALRTLEQTFVKTEKSGNTISVNFDSPTVREFVLSILEDDNQSIERIIKNAVAIEQLLTVATAGRQDESSRYSFVKLKSTTPRFNLQPVSHIFTESVVRLLDQQMNQKNQIDRLLLALLSLPNSLLPSESWWGSTVDYLLSSWAEGKGRPSDVIRLLRFPQIADRLHTQLQSFKLALAKLWDNKTFADPDDWGAYLDIIEEFFEEEFPSDTVSIFEDLVENEIWNSSLKNEVDFDGLIRIAERLELPDSVIDLDERRDELLSSVDMDDDIDGYRGSGSSSESGDAAAIESMFNRFR